MNNNPAWLKYTKSVEQRVCQDHFLQEEQARKRAQAAWGRVFAASG